MRTRSALLLAAAVKFDRLGYERTTLSDISAGAQVSKGALSFHFASKAELADAVQAMGCETARVRLERLRREGVPALQILVDMTHAAAEQVLNNQVIRAGVRLSYERDTPLDARVNLFANWRELFGEVAQEADREESLRSGCPPLMVAGLALSQVCWMFACHRGVSPEAPRYLTDVWKLLLPAISSGRSAPSAERSPPDRAASPPAHGA